MPSLKFSTKLIGILFVVSLLPLIILAFTVTRSITKQHQTFLELTFNKDASLRLQMVRQYLQTQKKEVSGYTQLTELKDTLTSYSRGGQIDNDRLFSSLTAIQHQNSYIESISILNKEGTIIASTATDQIGENQSNSEAFTTSITERTTLINPIIINKENKRVIPITSIFVREQDDAAIGVILVEYNSSVIKALFSGTLDITAPIEVAQLAGGEAYIIDSLGYPLTELNVPITQKNIQNPPITDCQQQQEKTGFWRNYIGQPVFGVAKCLEIEDHYWLLVVEQRQEQALQLVTVARSTILTVTAITTLLALLASIQITLSVTYPLNALREGVQQIGLGHFNHRINIKSRDEFQQLATAFNQMADKLSSQVHMLDQTAKLLLRRDLDLRETNEELELGKDNVETERRKLELVLAGVTDGVIAVDRSQNIIIFNPAAENITGYQAKHAIGKHISKILTLYEQGEELLPDAYAPTTTKKTGIVFNKENVKLIGENHKTSYINLISGSIQSNANVDLGSIITLHDVTQEQDFQKMKLDFASMAAHELRTPLTTVQGYLSFLQDDKTQAKLSDSEKEFINKAAASATRLNKLIENVLAVSKIEQGGIQLTLQETDMVSLITKLAEEYHGLAATKDLELIFNSPGPNFPKVMADTMRIEEVISNFIGNAVKYTTQGHIEISLTQQGEYIITSISDTGKGIPGDALPKLFTKFFRVQSELKSGSKGTGLGLYISKTIVELHGGKIWAESVVNQGSTFSFSLPLKQPAQLTATQTPQSPTSPSTSQLKTPM